MTINQLTITVIVYCWYENWALKKLIEFIVTAATSQITTQAKILLILKAMQTYEKSYEIFTD